MSNRIASLFGWIWSKNAPDPPSPGPPAAGTTFADTALNQADVESGWPYTSPVDSSIFNELMKRITTMFGDLETLGILPWCATTTYAAKALAFGSDGNLYQAIQISTNEDPTTATLYWTKTNLLEFVTQVHLQSQYHVYGIDTGSANAYAVAYNPAISGLVDGMKLGFRATHGNTTASTLAVNGGTAHPVLSIDAGALIGGEIVPGMVEVQWDNSLSSWIMISASGISGWNPISHIVSSPAYSPTVYHNTTKRAKLVAASGQLVTVGSGAIAAFVGTTSSPSQLADQDFANYTVGTSGDGMKVVFVVPAGWYYEIVDESSTGTVASVIVNITEIY